MTIFFSSYLGRNIGASEGNSPTVLPKHWPKHHHQPLLSSRRNYSGYWRYSKMFIILFCFQLLYSALYFLWNFLPEAFNAMLSSLKPVGGGGYGRHHLSRNGNKYGSGGLASYDDYDYNYSAAAEHYVSLSWVLNFCPSCHPYFLVFYFAMNVLLCPCCAVKFVTYCMYTAVIRA